MAKNKKTSYVAKLIRVMDEGELGMTDKWLRKDALKKNYYGKGSNRINELHDSLSDRTVELARIIDMFVNSDASSESCLKPRTIVNTGYEILRLRDKVQKETRKRMKEVDENGKEIKC